MSELAIGREARAGAFSIATVAVLVAVGVASFVAMLVLGAYAPDLRRGRSGGAHALSNAATGFSGIVELARATGRNPVVARSEHMFDTEDLVVITPESGRTPLDKVLGPRIARPTLVVLPKWLTVEDEDHRGWVRRQGLLPRFEPEGVLAPQWKLKVTRHPSGGQALASDPDLVGVRVRAPRPLQVVRGPKLLPLISDGTGGVVLGRLGDGPLYVLADPDLLSNKGMKDAAQAAAALAILDWLNSTGADAIYFDVTLNGLGHSPSPLKLLFEPPFLALTLALAAMLLLAGVQATARFGPVRRRERAIAFGKAALVDNSAALVRKAGREARLGGRFAEVMRERAAIAFGAPARLRGAALDAYLDRLGSGERFTVLAAAAEGAQDRRQLLDAAQALHRWKKEIAG